MDLDRLYNECTQEHGKLLNSLKEHDKPEIHKQIALVNSLMLTCLKLRSLKRKMLD
jgi:hypothetical protein